MAELANITITNLQQLYSYSIYSARIRWMTFALTIINSLANSGTFTQALFLEALACIDIVTIHYVNSLLSTVLGVK